ncbi:MAG: hypothetical protein R3C25_03490 [Hyphomonadaceae bacterium]
MSTPAGLVFAAGSRHAPALAPGELLYRSWDQEHDPPSPPPGLAPITRIELVRVAGWRPDRAVARIVEAENAAYWPRREVYRERLEIGGDDGELSALDPGRQPTAPQRFAIYRMHVERTLLGEARPRLELATQTLDASGRRIPIIAPRGGAREDREELRERGVLIEVSRYDECQYGYGFALNRHFLFYWSGDFLVAVASLSPQVRRALLAPVG